jgi:pre-mRNA-splicing factor CDC5/CEF1
MKRKPMAVQRNLPRPTDMNDKILRPADMSQSLNEYQKAEEMIKEEMLIMLHHDAVADPSLNQCGIPAGSKKPLNMRNLKPLNEEKHDAFLRENNYDYFSLDEINQVN